MTEYRLIIGLAAAIVIVSMLGMLMAHGEHYRRRELQLLRARVKGIEEILTGEHK